MRRTQGICEPVDHSLFGESALVGGAVSVLQLWPAAAIQDSFHAVSAEAAALPSLLTPMRGAPEATFHRGEAPTSRRLAREARRIVNQFYDATWRRLRWRRLVVPFE